MRALPAGVESVELHATITRADGTVVPQGLVAYAHRNRFKQMLVRLRTPRLRMFGGIGKVRTHAGSRTSSS